MPDDKDGSSGSSSGSSSEKHIMTFSTIAPALLVAAVSLGCSYYGKVDKLLDFARVEFLTAVIPVECFETGRPMEGCVNQVFPWLILAMMTFMMGVTIKIFLSKPSKVILDIIEQEFDKRHESLQRLLVELEEDFVRDESDDDIEFFNRRVVSVELQGLLELPGFDKKLAEEGFRWLWIVLAKDMRVSLKLTAAGEDVKYSSGAELQGCIDYFDRWMATARLHGFRPQGSERKLLYKLKWEAKKYLRTHGLKTLKKAFQLAIMAKGAFPWLLVQAICTAVSASMPALALRYRARALENLTDPQGNLFWQSAKAMVLIELLSTLLGILTDMVRRKAEALATKKLKLVYYDGLLKMPVTFWSMQTSLKHERVDFGTVYFFGREVTDFLAVPQDVLRDIVSSLTYAYTVLQTSSRALFLLTSANIASVCLKWVIRKAESWLSDLSTSGVIEPTQSEFMGCVYSLDPRYIGTYLSFVRGPSQIEIYDKDLTAEHEYEKRSKALDVFFDPVCSVVSQGDTITQLSSARTNVIEKGIGIAEANNMITSAKGFVAEAKSVTGIFGDMISKAKPLAKAYEIISLPKTIDPDKGLWPKHKAKGCIEFKDVKFSYPRRDVEVLKGVTFTVQPGDKIGLTGSAGCGKSTCMRLLERFYDVSAGSILLDGVDIKEYNPRWLRGQIATVAQEPTLVPLTIEENLTFGCVHRKPTQDDIKDALRAANIYDAIMDKDKFPEGLRTKIDPSGNNVSGGEKQRIAIARAILADPPILLLDEATSALDEDNQEKVQDALEKLMKGSTTLVIAHRLSTIKNSTKIVAFDKGKVFEEGTHDDLVMTEGSLYAKLWHKQTSKLADDEEEEEEAEEITPLIVEAGMNPKPTGLRRLQVLVQNLPDSDPKKKEIKSICKMWEQEQQGDVVHQRFIQRDTAKKWENLAKEHKVADKAGGAKLKSLSKKVMFNKAYEKMSSSLGEKDVL